MKNLPISYIYIFLCVLFASCSTKSSDDAVHQIGDPVEDRNESFEAGATGTGLESEQADFNTLMSLINTNEDLSTLASAINTVKLDALLSADSLSFTLFAPNNKAFEELPEGKLQELLQPENAETLKKILNFHLIKGNVASSDLDEKSYVVLSGEQVTIQKVDGLRVNKAEVISADMETTNGTIHIIDAVLIP